MQSIVKTFTDVTQVIAKVVKDVEDIVAGIFSGNWNRILIHRGTFQHGPEGRSGMGCGLLGVNAVPADLTMASYALAPDSAKSKALESWHPAAGTVTNMGGDDTVQTDTAARTNTLSGAGHGWMGRHDQHRFAVSILCINAKWGCAHLYGQNGGKGLPRHLLCVVQQGLVTGSIEQIQTSTTT